MSSFSLEDLKQMGKDNVLQSLGLQQQSSVGDNALPVIAAFGAGIIAGLCAGMLLAPASGEESRKRISEQAQKAQEAGSDMVDRAKDTVKAS